MPQRQTRRQASKARDTPVSSDEEHDMKLNGNGTAHHASDASGDDERENIFLFWPNIIGYFRIVLAIASLYYMPLHPRTCTVLYSVSCLLDALDGYVARVFEQSTRFGAVLDMVTDRCTTACLLVFLSSAFPRWAIIFQGLIALDLASHYMHMYATLVVSGSDSSHKNIDKSKSFVLNLYYTNKIVLFVFCALNEVFFIALYLLSFSSPLLSPHLIKTVEKTSGEALQPGVQVNTSILRQIFPDPFSAAALELARANKMDSFWPWVIAGISFPIMFGKQIINVVQLINASKGLADVDIKARKAQGLPRPKPKKA
ncbi:CDP-alcohol phosphatidyltransferase-domain-containing protein [Ilyonectria robusta]|uniref:CDP-alcohol phosphatidyltransferase-domain-containing protein n=1 Tax=Ilyonectria robusta TaxID=1079257 RepID=UPI001E8D77E9|nr:CDP-alcohol phosphatidyltransferase-domain-containing protein [Ilyonectria robusta]KAH6983006.1 CDP-alcohol phosphatidyltransferase-domain-containing protein [Ilyonectria sp. MPI-CAGE-AT-0026]KAH8706615.1 CDP-alcohol phosphatidyltransferase-domain-containing protein [Ilyonectria robusta]